MSGSEALSAIIPRGYALLALKHLYKIAVIVKATVHRYVNQLFVRAHYLLAGGLYAVVVEVLDRRFPRVFFKGAAEVISVHVALLCEVFKRDGLAVVLLYVAEHLFEFAYLLYIACRNIVFGVVVIALYYAAQHTHKLTLNEKLVADRLFQHCVDNLGGIARRLAPALEYRGEALFVVYYRLHHRGAGLTAFEQGAYVEYKAVVGAVFGGAAVHRAAHDKRAVAAFKVLVPAVYRQLEAAASYEDKLTFVMPVVYHVVAGVYIRYMIARTGELFGAVFSFFTVFDVFHADYQPFAAAARRIFTDGVSEN